MWKENAGRSAGAETPSKAPARGRKCGMGLWGGTLGWETSDPVTVFDHEEIPMFQIR